MSEFAVSPAIPLSTFIWLNEIEASCPILGIINEPDPEPPIPILQNSPGIDRQCVENAQEPDE